MARLPPWCICYLVVGAILTVCGTTMLALYHTDDRHANAQGLIVGNDGCQDYCSNTNFCYGEGTVAVSYQYDTGDPAGWYSDSISAPLFCSSDCCGGYIAGNITVYFYVDDGSVMAVSVVPDTNLHTLLLFGAIVLIVGILTLSVGVVSWRKSRAYKALN